MDHKRNMSFILLIHTITVQISSSLWRIITGRYLRVRLRVTGRRIRSCARRRSSRSSRIRSVGRGRSRITTTSVRSRLRRVIRLLLWLARWCGIVVLRCLLLRVSSRSSSSKNSNGRRRRTLLDHNDGRVVDGLDHSCTLGSLVGLLMVALGLGFQDGGLGVRGGRRRRVWVSWGLKTENFRSER